MEDPENTVDSKCPKHFLDYEFYCMQCMQLICKKCITDHSKENHVVYFLEDYGKQYLVSAFDEITEEIKKNKEEINLSPVQSKEIAGELIESLKTLKQALERDTKSLGKEIETLERLKTSSFLLPNIDELLRIIGQSKKSLEEEVKKSTGIARAIEIVQSTKSFLGILASNTEKLRRVKGLVDKAKEDLGISGLGLEVRGLIEELKTLSSNKLVSYSARVGLPLSTFNLYGIKEQGSVMICYNLDTKSCGKANIPIEIPTEPTLTQIEDRLYITGGGNYLDKTIEYMESTDTAICKAPMSIGKKWHSTVVLNETQFLAIGGYNNTHKHLNVVERFTTDENIWEDLPKLNEPKQSVAACLFERKEIYVFGGYSGIRHNTVEYLRISPMATKWLVINVEDPHNFPAFSCGAAAQISLSEILILRGNRTQESYTYNVNEKAIKRAEDMKQKDSFLLQGMYPIKNRLCAMGYFGEAHIFDYQSQSWEEAEYILS